MQSKYNGGTSRRNFLKILGSGVLALSLGMGLPLRTARPEDEIVIPVPAPITAYAGRATRLEDIPQRLFAYRIDGNSRVDYGANSVRECIEILPENQLDQGFEMLYSISRSLLEPYRASLKRGREEDEEYQELVVRRLAEDFDYLEIKRQMFEESGTPRQKRNRLQEIRQFTQSNEETYRRLNLLWHSGRKEAHDSRQLFYVAGDSVNLMSSSEFEFGRSLREFEELMKSDDPIISGMLERARRQEITQILGHGTTALTYSKLVGRNELTRNSSDPTEKPISGLSYYQWLPISDRDVAENGTSRTNEGALRRLARKRGISENQLRSVDMITEKEWEFLAGRMPGETLDKSMFFLEREPMLSGRNPFATKAEMLDRNGRRFKPYSISPFGAFFLLGNYEELVRGGYVRLSGDHPTDEEIELWEELSREKNQYSEEAVVKGSRAWIIESPRPSPISLKGLPVEVETNPANRARVNPFVGGKYHVTRWSFTWGMEGLREPEPVNAKRFYWNVRIESPQGDLEQIISEGFNYNLGGQIPSDFAGRDRLRQRIRDLFPDGKKSLEDLAEEYARVIGSFEKFEKEERVFERYEAMLSQLPFEDREFLENLFMPEESILDIHKEEVRRKIGKLKTPSTIFEIAKILIEASPDEMQRNYGSVLRGEDKANIKFHALADAVAQYEQMHEEIRWHEKTGRLPSREFALVPGGSSIQGIKQEEAQKLISWAGWKKSYASVKNHLEFRIDRNDEDGKLFARMGKENYYNNPIDILATVREGQSFSPSLEMSRKMITNEEFLEYRRETHQIGEMPRTSDQPEVADREKRWNREKGSFAAGAEKNPATDISFSEFEGFAKWRSERERLEYRISTNSETERAKRSWDGRRWVRGNLSPRVQTTDFQEFQNDLAIGRKDFCEVGAHDGDRSVNGIFDLMGNASELTDGSRDEKKFIFGEISLDDIEDRGERQKLLEIRNAYLRTVVESGAAAKHGPWTIWQVLNLEAAGFSSHRRTIIHHSPWTGARLVRELPNVQK